MAHGVDNDVRELAGTGCVRDVRLLVEHEEDVHEVAGGAEVIWRRATISGRILSNATRNVPLSTLGYVNEAKRPVERR